jgi:peptide/nickel transport system permease protein
VGLWVVIAFDADKVAAFQQIVEPSPFETLLSRRPPSARPPSPSSFCSSRQWGVTRSVALDLMSREFIQAAQAHGERISYILVERAAAQCRPAIVVEGSLRIAFAILLGAVLRFLGFGAQPPAADWGLMISTARDFVEAAPWMAIAPGMAMSVTVIAVSVLGDRLREHLDPRLDGCR